MHCLLFMVYKKTSSTFNLILINRCQTWRTIFAKNYKCWPNSKVFDLFNGYIYLVKSIFFALPGSIQLLSWLLLSFLMYLYSYESNKYYTTTNTIANTTTGYLLVTWFTYLFIIPFLVETLPIKKCVHTIMWNRIVWIKIFVL